MKSLEIQIQQIEERLESTGNRELLAVIGEKRRELRAMQDRYDQFVDEIGVFGSVSSEEDRLILRMARMFGECEITAPAGFVTEVKRYIAQWKATNRLASAVKRAEEGGFPTKIYLEMVRRHLPPQFFYLALQESNFDRFAIGPKTRFGIAKGFWQFIPSTAIRYGLSTGPLVEIRRFDPLDERFNFEKSTVAAAKYLRDMFRTEAQASGLLVMASYNWGHNRVRKRILEMPPDPKERNFWKLLKTTKIPKETYDYVYYIFSAAVIGENPALFKFDFENPFLRIDEEDVLGPDRPPASSR